MANRLRKYVKKKLHLDIFSKYQGYSINKMNFQSGEYNDSHFTKEKILGLFFNKISIL